MAAIGITFQETMQGWFALDQDDPHKGSEAGQQAGQKLAMHARVEIADLDAFVGDPDHPGDLTGTVDFAPLGEGLTAEHGIFNLFSPTDAPETKYMIYELGFKLDGTDYYLAGHKEVRNDPGFDLWADTTTLYTKLHGGADESAPVLGAGVLRLGVRELKDLLSTLKVTGAEGPADKARAISSFGSFFFGELWDIYAKSARS